MNQLVPDYPKTVEESASVALSKLDAASKLRSRDLNRAELGQLHFDLGLFVRNSLGLWASNERRLDGFVFGVDADDVSMMISEQAWEMLQNSSN